MEDEFENLEISDKFGLFTAVMLNLLFNQPDEGGDSIGDLNPGDQNDSGQ